MLYRIIERKKEAERVYAVVDTEAIAKRSAKLLNDMWAHFAQLDGKPIPDKYFFTEPIGEEQPALDL